MPLARMVAIRRCSSGRSATAGRPGAACATRGRLGSGAAPAPRARARPPARARAPRGGPRRCGCRGRCRSRRAARRARPATRSRCRGWRPSGSADRARRRPGRWPRRRSSRSSAWLRPGTLEVGPGVRLDVAHELVQHHPARLAGGPDAARLIAALGADRALALEEGRVPDRSLGPVWACGEGAARSGACRAPAPSRDGGAVAVRRAASRAAGMPWLEREQGPAARTRSGGGLGSRDAVADASNAAARSASRGRPAAHGARLERLGLARAAPPQRTHASAAASSTRRSACDQAAATRTPRGSGGRAAALARRRRCGQRAAASQTNRRPRRPAAYAGRRGRRVARCVRMTFSVPHVRRDPRTQRCVERWRHGAGVS